MFVVAAEQDAFEGTPASQMNVDGFLTAPGMFSHQDIDAGSKLLAAHLPDGQLGSLADFGCGWGYLAVQALKRGQAESVALVDAHLPSLQVAVKNVSAHHPGTKISTHWLDLLAETPPAGFDTIIMNPPFHSERETNVDLGVTFVEKAANALKPGGRLAMVANRQLPYEQVLTRCFKRWAEVQSDSRFKVFSAFR